MSRHREHDLTSNPSAEHLADDELTETDLDEADPRRGGNPSGAPRSLHATELVPDDEDIAAGDEWDDPERL